MALLKRVHPSEVRFVNMADAVGRLTPTAAITSDLEAIMSRDLGEVFLSEVFKLSHSIAQLSDVETDVETADSGRTAQPDPKLERLLDHLIKSLSKPNSVVAIIAEPIEDHSAVHITTFADPLDEATRDAVYAAECELIDRFGDTTFDFHLRQPEHVQGRIVIPPSPYAMILWQRPASDAYRR